MENGVGVDLTRADITLHLKNDIESVNYTIPCEGAGLSHGRVTIPFTNYYLSVSGLFFGQFVTTFPYGGDVYFEDYFFEDDFFGDDGGITIIQHTYPTTGYVNIKIEKAI